LSARAHHRWLDAAGEWSEPASASFAILRAMRRALPVWALVLVFAGAGCASGTSSGSLWALDEAHLEEELVYRTPDPQRAAQARQYQLRVADEVLDADQARLEALLATCPEPRQDRLEPSAAARARDGVRARQDPDRSARAGRLAAADWYLRRAATSGETALCERARQTLGATGRSQPQQPDLAAGQVVREPPGQEAVDGTANPYRALTTYGLGLVDVVRGPAALVGHLATVYGGSLEVMAVGPTSSPEEVVDRLAPSLAWEPDGLYAALQAAR
jgi:hypothetical protein